MDGGFQRIKKKIKQLRGWLVRRLHRTHVRGLGGNKIIFNDARLYRCQIVFTGTGNVLEIGADTILHQVNIAMVGSGNRLQIGEGVRIRAGATLVVEDSKSTVSIGAATTMTSPTIVCSEGGRITIGQDCMIAMGTCIRNSDGHSILDSATSARINPAADIAVGNHVWLGIKSLILKGSAIGDGAIIGAHSIVTGRVEAVCIAVGSPAQTIRRNILWTRERNAENRPPYVTASIVPEPQSSQPGQ